jgi:hypothetical protein
VEGREAVVSIEPGLTIDVVGGGSEGHWDLNLKIANYQTQKDEL